MSTPVSGAYNIVNRGAIRLYGRQISKRSTRKVLSGIRPLQRSQTGRCIHHSRSAKYPSPNGRDGNETLRTAGAEDEMEEHEEGAHNIQIPADEQSGVNGDDQSIRIASGVNDDEGPLDAAGRRATALKPASSSHSGVEELTAQGPREQTLLEDSKPAHGTSSRPTGKSLPKDTLRPRERPRLAYDPLENAKRACSPLLLTFDAFGTLYTPKVPIAQQYSEIAAQHGFIAEQSKVHAAFQKAFKTMSSAHPNYGKNSIPKMSYILWWKRVIDSTFTSILHRKGRAKPQYPSRALKNALYDRFTTSTGYSLYADVRTLLETIGKGFNPADWPPKRTLLGIISNSDPRVRSVMKSFDIRIEPIMFPPRVAPVFERDRLRFGHAHFAFATLSYEVEAEKPDPRIFRAAASHAQHTLNKMAPVARLTRSYKDLLTNVATEFHHMHVGDDVEKDIVPALNCGWDAVLLDRSLAVAEGGGEGEVEERKLDNGKVYPVISSLTALPKLLTPQRVSSMMEARINQLKAQGVDLMDGIPKEVEEGGYGLNPALIRAPPASGPPQKL